MKKIVILLSFCVFAGRACAQDYIITETSCQPGKVTRHGKDQLAFRKQGIEPDYDGDLIELIIESKKNRVNRKTGPVSGL